ncbi:MAG: glycosyltransferase family 4 protein, partial [Clostridia bacterium]|nr:glycosyltransferase family 4 protein [Clostridia bacterium]
MNILFVSISTVPSLCGHSISIDLIHELCRNGHSIYVLCSQERRNGKPTSVSEEAGCKIVRVRTGNLTKTNVIEKGISTLLLPYQYMNAVKKYYGDIKFDLVMYPTPPVTQVDVVKYIKKRDGARSYLLLKDIFPQNAVDIGMLKTSGVKGILYKNFRRSEKKLYSVSDYIGCMSQANVDYLLKHNPDISSEKVEICPNSIEVEDKSVTATEREEMRRKYNIPLDKKVFIYGGNLGRPQGIPFLIECLKTQLENTDAYFVVVGNGTEFGKLQAFFDANKPENMCLMQRLPKEDYDRLVAACDVGMIFLDHRFTIPNFPSRLLSYMQAKIPVLACTDPNTDVGKVIEEGNFGVWCES